MNGNYLFYQIISKELQLYIHIKSYKLNKYMERQPYDQDSYQQGYNQGYNQGHQHGYNQGYKQGYYYDIYKEKYPHYNYYPILH